MMLSNFLLNTPPPALTHKIPFQQSAAIPAKISTVQTEMQEQMEGNSASGPDKFLKLLFSIKNGFKEYRQAALNAEKSLSHSPKLYFPIVKLPLSIIRELITQLLHHTT